MADNIIRSLFSRLGFQVDASGAKKYNALSDKLVAKTEQTAQKIESIALNIGSALAAAFSVGAAKEFVRDQAEATYEIERFASSTGIATDQLQRWGFAAQQAGLSFDDFAQSAVDLTVRAAESLDGGEQQEFFAQLGLSATDASGKLKTTEQLFLDFTDSLAKSTKRLGREKTVEIVDALLGDAGTKQFGYLSQGSAAFLEMANSAEAAALVIDQDAIDATRRLTQTQLVLGGALRGVANDLLVKLAPAIEAGAKRMTAFLQDGDKVKKALTILKVAVVAVSTAFASAKIGAFAQGLIGLPALLISSARGMTLLGAATKAFQLTLAVIPALLAGGFLLLRDISSMLEGGPSKVGDFISKFEQADGILGTIARALRSAAPALGAIYERLSALGDKLLPMVERGIGSVLGALEGGLGAGVESLLGLFETMGPALLDVLEKVGPMALGLAAKLQGIGAGLLAKLIPAISETVTMIAENIGPLLEVAMSLIDSIVTLIEPILPVILALVDASLAKIRSVMPVLTLVFGIFAALVDKVIPILMPVINFMSSAISTVFGLISKAYDVLAAIFGPAADFIMTWLKRLDNFLAPLIKKVKQVTDAVSNIPGVSAVAEFFGGGKSKAPKRDIVGSVLAGIPAQTIESQAGRLAASSSTTSSNRSLTMGDVKVSLTGNATAEGADALARKIPGAIDDEMTRRGIMREMEL